MLDVPTVSVLMTAYNRAKYIGAAIESVLASTFRDFELVVVDDGSTDGTQEIVKGYAARDSRVRFHQNETNLGDYPNRNKAASFARGLYLKYVDSDNVIYPHGLEVMIRCMEAFPDAALGLSRPQSVEKPSPYLLHPAESYRNHFLVDGVLSFGPLSTIIRRAAFEEAGGFSGARFYGDTELWLTLARTSPVVVMPDGLAWYRIHAEQEFAVERQTVRTIIQRFRCSDNFIMSSAGLLSETDRDAARRQLRTSAAMTLLLLLKQGRLSDAVHVARGTDFSVASGLHAFWRLLMWRIS